MKRVFFPNLDADHELGAGGPYQPTRTTLEQIRRQLPRLAGLALGDEVLDREQPRRFDPDGDGYACCWCPTPHALATLHRAGWPTPPAPPLEVLRRVNDRHFLFQQLAHDDLLQQLAHDDALGRRWVGPSDDGSWLAAGQSVRLKRRFGFAGKGQRTVAATPSLDDLRWIADSRRDGFACERECEVVSEWCLHGMIDREGVLIGTPCRQFCDAFGRAIRHERSSFAHEQVLYASAERVAALLGEAGYFGPFGIDAFCYRDGEAERFNALSDLNARFTLAWALGMGALRDEALARLRD
jgi:hypothetical protein